MGDTEDRLREAAKSAIRSVGGVAPIVDNMSAPPADQKKWEAIGTEIDSDMPETAAEGGSYASVGGEGADANFDARMTMYPMQLQQPQAGVIRPKLHDPFQVGGQETIDQATKVQHENAAQAIEKTGEAREQGHQQLADIYGGEAERQKQATAIEEAQRQADIAEFQRRQANIDKKSDEIANHQISRGRWFRNPGNILSAIGASLMTLASDDHTVGMKLIENAIQKDVEDQRYDHEQMQADLTGMRTNVGMFRQLVNDRQAGDMLHEAKVRDVTAQKIMQIGESLRSKEAKQAAIAEASMLRQQGAQIRMAVYQRIFMAPKMTTPGMKNAEMAGGVEVAEPYQAGPPTSQIAGPSGPGIQAAGQPQGQGQQVPSGQPQMPKPMGLQAPPGSVEYRQPTPPQTGGMGSRSGVSTFNDGESLGERTGVSTRTAGDALSGTGQEDVEPASVGGKNGFRRPENAAQFLTRRTGIPDIEKRMNAERARNILIVQSQHPGNPAAQNKAMAELEQKAAEKAGAIAQQHINYATYEQQLGYVQKRFQELNQSFGGDHEKMDKFLGQNYKFVVGSDGLASIHRAKDWLTDSGDLSDAERHAADKYAQELGTVINAYIKTMSGAAVNKSEEGRLKTAIHGAMTTRNIQNWLNVQSKGQAAVLSDILASAGTQGTYLWLTSKGIQDSNVPHAGSKPRR